MIQSLNFDTIKLIDQVGEQIVILYWEMAIETRTQDFEVAAGQEPERDDAFNDHDAHLLLQ
jgi:hypothetical protein